LTEKEFWMFMQTARIFGLNPLKREIYAVKYGDRFSIITGYQVYLQRIINADILEYWQVEIEKPDPKNSDTWIGVFTAKRKDWTKEFVWKVPMIEANKKQALWNTQREFQLKKTTISQGCRMLAPDIVGGIPYTNEELGVEEESQFETKTKVELPKADPEALKKMKVIEDVFKAIDKNKTIAELDAWVAKNVEKIGKSPNRETYEARIGTRTIELTILYISEKTGLANIDVAHWCTKDVSNNPSKAVDALLGGDDDAIVQVRAEITDYVKSLEILEDVGLDGLCDGEQEM